MIKKKASHQYWVEHSTLFGYQSTVQRSVMSLRLKPRSDMQKFWNFSLEVKPFSVPVEFTDCFGNCGHLLTTERSHSELSLKSGMYAETQSLGGSIPELSEKDWDSFNDIAPLYQFWEYLKPSQFVLTSSSLLQFLSEQKIERGRDPMTSLLHASSMLFGNLRYLSETTDVDSSIETALDSGGGVCQDFTHIFLAIARSWGIPARYVSGYFEPYRLKGYTPPRIETHAWAECFLPEIGWLGFDPTNDCIVDHRYICLAIGRDYADVPPTKGVVYGGGASEVELRVKVVDVTDTPEL